MIYTSSYGETFKMDCGKRHGTTTLSMGYTETFTDCRHFLILNLKYDADEYFRHGELCEDRCLSQCGLPSPYATTVSI